MADKLKLSAEPDGFGFSIGAQDMPQPPMDGSWVRFFGRWTGDAGIVARWHKTGTAPVRALGPMPWQRPNIGSRVNREVHAPLFEGYWQSPEGTKLAAIDFDRWEVVEPPKKP
jgi:hypothetical protein